MRIFWNQFKFRQNGMCKYFKYMVIRGKCVIFVSMKITIELTCPRCQSVNILKNGHKITRKQNYLCKDCGSQFIGDYALIYPLSPISSQLSRLYFMSLRYFTLCTLA